MYRTISAAVLAMLAGMAVQTSAEERTVRLSVPGMTCVSCPYIIERSISGVKGVKAVKATFADRTAIVTYDDEATSLDAITQATGDVGFESSVVEAGEKS